METGCDRPGLMPISEALEHLLSSCNPNARNEQVNLFDGLNRVLAESVKSRVNVPPSDNSAMDGYAFFVDDNLPSNTTMMIQGQALAGKPFTESVKAGYCVRITTGGILPKGTNTVLMQENVTKSDNRITTNQAVRRGNSVRLAGEDIRQGQTVVTKGTRLSPAHLALIASVGIDKVSVQSKPKVAVIATGDELVQPGNVLEPGQIYESNRFALHGLLHKMAVDVLHYEIVRDHPESLSKVFLQASQEADMIISCGGVSVGDADYVKQVLNDIGNIDFWKVAIKPGKPFAFGHIGKTLFCGLPGNPVSSFVTFEQLVTPLLKKMMGELPSSKLTLQAKCAETIYKRPGRADFQRGICFVDSQGQLWVKPNGKQGSGIMSSIANANCYILLEIEQGKMEPGEAVSISLFDA